MKRELIEKSKEAALTAVQVFNNPNIGFKSETYVVMMNIAWTYLLHAYYRGKGIEYRYFERKGQIRRFDRTKHGAFKHWELERCLNTDDCPLDQNVTNNLKFMIGLRHEIEHQMTTRIDDLLSAKFQACCINYNDTIKILFGDSHGIDRLLSFSLQFATLSDEQVGELEQHHGLPGNIKRFVEGFDGSLSEEEFDNHKYAYRVFFIAKTANRKGQADRVIEFVKAGSELADKVNAEYTVIKEIERQKYRPGQIVQTMKDEGFTGFNMHHHTQLWQSHDARNTGKGFGADVAGTWFWYDRWVDAVRRHCRTHRADYT